MTINDKKRRRFISLTTVHFLVPASMYLAGYETSKGQQQYILRFMETPKDWKTHVCIKYP